MARDCRQASRRQVPRRRGWFRPAPRLAALARAALPGAGSWSRMGWQCPSRRSASVALAGESSGAAGRRPARPARHGGPDVRTQQRPGCRRRGSGPSGRDSRRQAMAPALLRCRRAHTLHLGVRLTDLRRRAHLRHRDEVVSAWPGRGHGRRHRGDHGWRFRPDAPRQPSGRSAIPYEHQQWRRARRQKRHPRQPHRAPSARSRTSHSQPSRKRRMVVHTAPEDAVSSHRV